MYQRIKELRIMNTLLNQLMKKLFKNLSQVEETSNYIHDLNKSRLFEEAKKAYYKKNYRNVIIHGIIIMYLLLIAIFSYETRFSLDSCRKLVSILYKTSNDVIK